MAHQDIIEFDQADGNARRHDGATATILETVSIQAVLPNTVRGIAFDRLGNFHYVMNFFAPAKYVYRHVGFTSTVDSFIATPSNGPYGVAWMKRSDHANYMYTTDATTDSAYVHQGFTTTIVASWATGKTLTLGISIDENPIIDYAMIEHDNVNGGAVRFLWDGTGGPIDTINYAFKFYGLGSAWEDGNEDNIRLTSFIFLGVRYIRRSQGFTTTLISDTTVASATLIGVTFFEDISVRAGTRRQRQVKSLIRRKPRC